MPLLCASDRIDSLDTSGDPSIMATVGFVRWIRGQAVRFRKDPWLAADAISLSGLAAVLVQRWLTERKVWQRLADVEVPSGALFIALGVARIRQIVIGRNWEQAAQSARELTDALTQRMRQSEHRANQELELQQSIERATREGEAREQRLLELQESVEAQTRWLVRLTVTLGLIGAAGIAATIWAAVR
jgi:hypothetical protein